MNKREDLFGEKVLCEYCGKGLKPFKSKFDWKKRKLHKKCYFIKIEEDRIRWIIEETRKQDLAELQREKEREATRAKMEATRKEWELKKIAFDCGVYDI